MNKYHFRYLYILQFTARISMELLWTGVFKHIGT